MLHKLIDFQPAQLFNAYRVRPADARQIVSHQVDDHDVLRAVLFALLQFTGGIEIRLGPRQTRTSPLDRPCFDLTSLNLDQAFRRGARNLISAQVEVTSERRGITLSQTNVKRLRITLRRKQQSLRKIDL